MNDIERARHDICRLRHALSCKDWVRWETAFKKESLSKSLDVVTKTLQEKAEREKGCDYCTGDVDERMSLINDDNEYIYIDGNGKLDLNDMHEVQLNYCPMCGRKLVEE